MERNLGPRRLYHNSNRLGQSILYVIYYEYTALYGISNRDGNWLRASRNRRLPAPALALGPLGPEACATVLGYFIARDWQALAKAMISDRNEAVAVGTKEGVVLNIVQGIANWEYQNSGTRSKRVRSESWRVRFDGSNSSMRLSAGTSSTRN
jgi:hypothetical protein